MNAETLKQNLRSLEDRHRKPALVRLHRAISWLARAQTEDDDPDVRFVFLWISFNATYAQELRPDLAERDLLATFFAQLIQADQNKRLHRILFDQFSGPIRTLVDNRFDFEPFWRALREHDFSDRWKTQFAASRKAARRSILDSDTLRVLSIVFDRMYVLRKRIVHGGATWNSSVNRAQVRDGATIMMSVVPVLIDLMLEYPELDIGEINYPVV